jgi:hypothetical protein
MGEYQFYQFKTVNRSLSKTAQADVDTWSSRGEVSSTTATFTYSYSSFRQNPEQCLLKHFDIYLHFGSYGTRHIMFKFPKKLVDLKMLKQYEYARGERHLLVRVVGDDVLVDMEENLEDSEETYGYESTLGNIKSLWNAILQGDYRCLYVLWLHFASLNAGVNADLDEDEYDAEEDDDDINGTEMPPVPAGLQQIDGSLTEFMSFWEISDDMIEAAAQLSPVKVAPEYDFQTAITRLSDAEKSNYLLRLAQDEPTVKNELIKHLKSLSGNLTQTRIMPQMTIQDILDLETNVRQARVKAEKAAADAKRRAELEQMVPKEAQMWSRVQTELDLKRASGYDNAVAMLVDLKALNAMLGKSDLFNTKMQAIRTTYTSKVFHERLVRAKL